MKASVTNFLRLSLPSLLLLVLLLELFFRFVIPASDPPMAWFDYPSGIYRFATDRPTGTVTVGTLAQQRGHWRINNAGWNSPVDYVREKTKPRIAIIGDSYIEAWQVDSDKSYPSILRNLLDGDFDVYSFGVSGAPLSHYLYMGRYVVDQFDPDVLIFNIVHNDFDESLARINSGVRHFMLLRMQDGRVEETTPAADPSSTQFSISKQILRKSAFVRYLMFNLHIENTLRRLRYRQQEYVANIDPTAIARDRDEIRVAVHYIVDRMRDDFQDREIVFVMDAPRSSIYSGASNENVRFLHEITAEACADSGVSLVDLTGPMRSAYEENGRRFESEWDGHWNEYGHQFVARAVAGALRDGLLDVIAKRYERQTSDEQRQKTVSDE